MASPIILIKRGDAAPVVGQLRVGELALDKVAGILYVGSGIPNGDGFASEIKSFSNAADVSAQIAALETSVSGNKTSIESLTGEVDGIKTAADALGARVTIVEGEAATAKTDIAALKTSDAANTTAVAELKPEMATAKSDIAGLKTSVEANTSGVSTLGERVTTLDAENVKLAAEQTVTGLKTFDAINVADKAKGDASTSAANTKFVTEAVADGVTAAGVAADAKIAAIGLDNLASLETSKPVSVGAPTEDNHAATKAYVDAHSQGLDSKDSVRVATTADIALTGLQTIDGVAVVAGDRVLVKNQTDAKQNGIYVAAEAAWARSTDADTWNEIVSAYVFIEEGTVNKDSGWVCTVDRVAEHTMGETDITFTQFTKAGDIEAGAGLAKTGNVLSIADSYTSGIDAKIAPKADKAYVDEQLALKANLADVNTALDGKASQAALEALTTTVGTKASQTDLDALTTTVGTKADTTALTTGLALKADTTALTDGLALKADKAAVEASLSDKANTADVTASLALKADITYVDTKFAVIDGGTF